MPSFTKRQKEILEILSKNNSSITGKELCSFLHVSLRTIQNDISQINEKSSVISSSNKGYVLNETYISAEELNKDFSDEHLILNYLFLHDSAIDLDELADSLYMSKSSLENKLHGCQLYLKSFNLEIIKHKNKISITGSERNKRSCIKSLIIKETFPTFNDVDNIVMYFPNLNIPRLKKILLTILKKHGYTLEEPYLTTVIVNAIITLHRMKNEHYIDEKISYEFLNNHILSISKDFFEIYSDHFSIMPSMEDIVYFGSLLHGQLKPHKKNDTSSESINKFTISDNFINQVNKILKSVFDSYSIQVDTEKYLYNFAIHISEMKKRILTSFPADNQLLENLKKNCPFIYDVSVKVSHLLETLLQIQIPDTEIGYICIHIGFILEESLNKTIINIALYGISYHQILSKIKQKIEKEHDKTINLTIVDTSQIQLLTQFKWDLIISTEQLNFMGKNIIYVSPFYTAEDQLNVNLFLKKVISFKEKRIISRSISNYFKRDLWYKMDENLSKEQAVYFLGKKLINDKIVEQDFINSVLERERLSSTCFYGNFAIPHALEMNATKTTICVLINKKEIQWDKTPINIVLMIAVCDKDRSKFMSLYDGLVKVLKEPKNISLLIDCQSFEEFINILEQRVNL